MTDPLFSVPAAWGGRRSHEVTARRDALSRVWIGTGNPKQPLACIWIDREMRITGTAYEPPADQEITAAGQRLQQICA